VADDGDAGIAGAVAVRPRAQCAGVAVETRRLGEQPADEIAGAVAQKERRSSANQREMLAVAGHEEVWRGRKQGARGADGHGKNAE
jgi:hypothetical protein